MSHTGTKHFSPTNNFPTMGNGGRDERGGYHSTDPPPVSLPVRGPQPRAPIVSVDNFETRGQAYQRTSSNEAGFPSQGGTSPRERIGVAPASPEQYRAYDKSQYVASTISSSLTPQYEVNEYQHRASPSTELRQGYSTQASATHRKEVSQSSTPLSRKAVAYPSPPSTGQQFQYPSPGPRDVGGYQVANPSQRNVSPYSPESANAMMTPDRSVIGSPLPQMSPDSLQRELDKTKDYAENILTKLIETTNLLKERDAEIAQLHDRLANAAAGGPGGSVRQFQQREVGSSWELDELRRKLYEHSQALRAAQDEAVTARSQAQHHQNQADMWARECAQLQQSQVQSQQHPTVDQAQMAEAQKVTDFYKQKVDRLSRDNMDMAQQNRKLTEELATAQRDSQQQRARIR